MVSTTGTADFWLTNIEAPQYARTPCPLFQQTTPILSAGSYECIGHLRKLKSVPDGNCIYGDSKYYTRQILPFDMAGR